MDKNGLNGYTKDTVIEYIDDVSISAENSIDILKSKITELQTENDKLRKEYSIFSEKLDNLTAQLKQKNVKIEKLEFNIEKIIDSTALAQKAMQDKLNKKDDIINDCKKQIADFIIEKSNYRVTMELLQTKSDKYDEMKKSIDKIRLDAELTAGKMIDEATVDTMETLVTANEAFDTINQIKQQISPLQANKLTKKEAINNLNEFFEIINTAVDKINGLDIAFKEKNNYPVFSQDDNNKNSIGIVALSEQDTKKQNKYFTI